MKKRRVYYRVFLSFVLAIAVFFAGMEWIALQKQENLRQEVSAKAVSKSMLIPGGMPIGIYMETDGVIVLGTEKIKDMDGQIQEPSKHLLKAGDYITGMNGMEIKTKKELIKEIEKLNKKDVILQIRRDKEEMNVKTEAVEIAPGKYQLGIWVRDSAQGLGTVTFLTGDSHFGALGHGIHDTDTNTLLEIADGRLYETSIQNIQKGKKGSPGGIEGVIVYNNYHILGNIDKNTDAGIYGTVDNIEKLFQELTPIPAAPKEEIQEGDAVIRCAVEGEVKDYKIRITKIDRNPKEINKGIVLEVTDERLLDLTGGIIQGMSGSPIIQNGKLVGAVTHVFVQDASKGYGIFIENMLNNV